MFGHGFFGAGYYGPGYWGSGSAAPAPASSYLLWGKGPGAEEKIRKQNETIQMIVAAIAASAFDHFRKDD